MEMQSLFGHIAGDSRVQFVLDYTLVDYSLVDCTLVDCTLVDCTLVDCTLVDCTPVDCTLMDFQNFVDQIAQDQKVAQLPVVQTESVFGL